MITKLTNFQNHAVKFSRQVEWGLALHIYITHRSVYTLVLEIPLSPAV